MSYVTASIHCGHPNPPKDCPPCQSKSSQRNCGVGRMKLNPAPW